MERAAASDEISKLCHGVWDSVYSLVLLRRLTRFFDFLFLPNVNMLVRGYLVRKCLFLDQ